MPIPFMPLVVATFVAAAYHQTSKKSPGKGVMTPERQIIFDTAINNLKDPKKLRTLAEKFRNEGLPAAADLLEKRAKLRELSPELKAARKAVFKKGMTSQDPSAVRKVADVFEREGATGAAGKLRDYAASLPPGSGAVNVPLAAPVAAPMPPPIPPPIPPMPPVVVHVDAPHVDAPHVDAPPPEHHDAVTPAPTPTPEAAAHVEAHEPPHEDAHESPHETPHKAE